MKQVTRHKASVDYEYSLIVDGNNILKISLVDKTMNNSGEEYGAVISFLRILGNILNKKDFNYCIVCFDGEGSGVLRCSGSGRPDHSVYRPGQTADR